MEGNLLEINGNLVMKGYGNACDGVGDFKENMQMINEGTKNSIALFNASEDEEKRALELKLLQMDVERKALENKKLESEMKRSNFKEVRDTIVEVGKFVGPIVGAGLTLGGAFGICALKHYYLKDTITYNCKLQSQGHLGINDQKLVDVSLNDFKSVK